MLLLLAPPTSRPGTDASPQRRRGPHADVIRHWAMGRLLRVLGMFGNAGFQRHESWRPAPIVCWVRVRFFAVDKSVVCWPWNSISEEDCFDTGKGTV